MADALVSVALEKLNDVVRQQLSVFAGATGELQKLSSTFQSIQAVLADAEGRQVGDRSVKLWLSNLRHAAYDIQDLLEEEQISGIGDEEGNEDDGNRRKKARLLFGIAYNLWDHYKRNKIASDIKEIRERLDGIADDKNKYSFRSSTQVGNVRSRLLTTSLMDKSEMIIGREHDKELIISRLVSGGSHEDGGQARVVAIFGMGGLGKTTVARLIYHDARVRDHFKAALYWVSVSEVFDVIRLTKAILEQVERTVKEHIERTVNFPSEPDTLQKELLEALRGKRFLLVLDDVWNDDAEKWDMLRLPLNSGAQGSRILVTTRGQKVANTMNATFVHELRGLSDDDSWEVFMSRAFAGRTSEECSKLENVGREIVKKCRGVPLALTVMGSAMNSKRTMADWQNILASEMWALLEAENKILPALWLSYYNLPPQSKQCFAYCAMFPKDWGLKKDMLVRLWVAQGFIGSKGNRDIEDIGADCFDDLVAWSMFQEVEKNSAGAITYKMHDLLHDLAKFIAKDEIYTFTGKSEQCPIASNVRHSFLFFTESTDDKFNKIQIALGKATKLRTLFLHGLDRIEKFIVDIFREARFVRALVFSGSRLRMVKLPNAIGGLRHLRYLDLSGLDIVDLPESVSNLRNLHTLNLSNCEKLEKLPRGIGGVVSLRHLEIEGTDRLKYLPKGLGRISGLRGLSKFIVGGGDEGEGCGIDELQRLNSLQGSLEINCLQRVASQEEAEKAELWKKQHLCSLALEMSEERHDDAETERIDRVLEGLRPHGNLENLKITGFSGSKLPSWMDRMRNLRKLLLYSGPKLERVPHLPSLKEFKIEAVRNEILPDAGWEQLVALQKLRIDYCAELKCLPEGLTQLPSLENLHIFRCGKLESLPEGLGQLKKLKSLTIDTVAAKSLDVCGSEVFRCLPNSVGRLESLKFLCISSCKKLESVPDSLGQLRHLKSLVVGGSEVLRCLPDSLGQLRQLKSLVVGGSEVLRCLPDSVGQLESLERLKISSYKKLESLPASLGQLKKLKSLHVSGSEVLGCLPDSLGQLESLESLDIRYCKKLESLPVSLGQLKKFKSLHVGGSEVLRCLPNSVAQLESLEHLRISSCKKLESLPESLGQLKKLKLLHVSGSKVLRCLPDSLGQLESLEILHISSCKKLESLPVSLGQLKKLNLLDVGGSEVLRCLPDSLGQLESLEHLHISSYKKLESLPVSFGQLKKLRLLTIDGLQVMRCLPDSVGQLESLKHLRIYNLKKLESLPDSLGQLKALSGLVIRDCQALPSLPQGLRNLSLLRTLNICRCPLLWERCKREGGVDWPNISHIPHIDIT